MGDHDEDRAYRRRQQRRFPQHACELPPHPDRVYPALPPDASRWARVRRFLQKWCVGWRASKQLRAIRRSTYTLESEQARQSYQKYCSTSTYTTKQSYREIHLESELQYRWAWYIWFLAYQFRVVRWRYVFIYTMNWCRMANLRSTTRNVILYTLCLLAYVMWTAYLSYQVPLLFRGASLFRNNSDSWMMDPAIGFFDVSNPKLPLRQVLLCFNRVIAVVTTHIPDYSSDTPRMTYEDHVLLFIMMWTSAAFKIALLSLIVQIAGTICNGEAQLQKVRRQVRNYMREKNLPIHVRHKMMLYYDTKFDDRFFKQRAIIAHLPSTVRNAVRLATSRQLVSSSALFRSVPKSLVNRIVAELHEDLYLANDVVFSYGSAARHLYFLSTGTVGMYVPTGEEVAHMADGAVFGIMGFMLPQYNRRQMVSVVALEVCEVFVMEKRAFERLVRPLPRLYNRIRTIAMKRAEEVAPPMGFQGYDYGYGYERPVSPPSSDAADSTAASPSGSQH